jgi:5-methylcytosine-specific restriction enzyme B
MPLDQRLVSRLKDTRKTMEQRGRLLTAERIDAYLAAFRSRFGPDQLRAVSGRALLDLMHRHGNRDSLVYWLEFKDDEEFVTRPFGSIAGGSALKFRLYLRAETGAWTAGSSKGQHTISIDEAIAMAESHRAQLLAGLEAVSALGPDADLAGYRALQDQIDKVAPDIASLGWAHKYLYLLASDRLDDYHAFYLQKFMHLKLLRMPPEDDRRYEAAYWFKTVARELEWRMPHLTNVLNECFGELHRYWRIDVLAGSMSSSRWATMREHACVALEDPSVGDLSDITPDSKGREALRQRFASRPPSSTSAATEPSQLFNFVRVVQPGDVVVATDRDRVLGVGRITGEYAYEVALEHVRPVAWQTFAPPELPDPGEARDATCKLIQRVPNILALERHLLDAANAPEVRAPPVVKVAEKGGPWPVPLLPGISGRIQAALERKGQVIIYGPPGTGKTYQAERTLRELAALQNFDVPFQALTPAQRAEVLGDERWGGYVRLVSFHPGYGYEDFIEGYRPSADGGRVGFTLRDGLFKRLCADAAAKPDRRLYLLVDEINRADVPRVLGELMTVLELDKRSKEVVLPLSGTRFRIPENVRLAGTMNTADRSIALLDAALRRRFAFIELMPDELTLESDDGDVDVSALLRNLNARIRQHVKRDARSLQVGHAYLLESGKPITDVRRLARVLQDDVIPLVQEYCYDDPEALRAVLGSGFVSLDCGGLRLEVFERTDELLTALAQLGDDVVRTAAAAPGPQVAGEEDAK